MNLRRVLIVTYHFPPSAASGSFRLMGFVRHLPKFGWRSVVVAPPRLPWEAVDVNLVRDLPPETVVYHVRHDLRGPLGLALKFYAPLSSWLPKAWWACTRAVHRHRPEVMLTSGPPHMVHRLGLLLKRQHRLPWVADFRDPWVAGVEAAGGTPRGARRAARVEAAVMGAADAIVANTPGSCAVLRDAYPEAAARMVAITNGYDPEAFVAFDAPARAGSELKITHPGQLYAGRDPRPFLDAIRDLERDRPAGFPPLRAHFVGNLDGQDTDLVAAIRGRGLEEVVTVSGPVSYSESLREMMQSDILLLLDSPGRSAGVPAKVYEYIGAARPILALAESDGDLAWVLRESGVPYRIAPPGDPARIKRALVELVAAAREAPKSARVQQSASRFTRESLTGELATILDSCGDRCRKTFEPVPEPSTGPMAAASRPR